MCPITRTTPLFELSDATRWCTTVIRRITATVTGLRGIIQNNVSRVVASSTLRTSPAGPVRARAAREHLSPIHIVRPP
ncbi:hypothetical protein [Burkholderia thailandensis]|uniref:hypothetical protein n=1 Tax=Burkholderia thailandensis TaxID=57975 RepID=UPI0035C69416